MANTIQILDQGFACLVENIDFAMEGKWNEAQI